MDHPAQVSLEVEATDGEVAAIAAAFTEAGIPAEVLADHERRGIGDFPWLVVVSVPVTTLFTTLAAEAGKDAYKVFKRLVGQIYEARKASSAPKGSLTFIDDETGTWIALPPDLPDEAWQLLPEAQLKELPSGALRWDSTTERWRDAWDEG